MPRPNGNGYRWIGLARMEYARQPRGPFLPTPCSSISLLLRSGILTTASAWAATDTVTGSRYRITPSKPRKTKLANIVGEKFGDRSAAEASSDAYDKPVSVWKSTWSRIQLKSTGSCTSSSTLARGLNL